MKSFAVQATSKSQGQICFGKQERLHTERTNALFPLADLTLTHRLEKLRERAYTSRQQTIFQSQRQFLGRRLNSLRAAKDNDIEQSTEDGQVSLIQEDSLIQQDVEPLQVENFEEVASTSVVPTADNVDEKHKSALSDVQHLSAASEQLSAPQTPPETRSEDSLNSPDSVRSHPLQLPDDDLFGTKELIGELQDQKLIGKRGEGWLFAQIAAVLFVLFPPIPVKGLVDLLGVLAITAGIVFMLYAVVCLGRQISPLPAPRKKHQLVTSGIYAYVRHPIYGGLLMAALGLAALTRSEGRLAVCVVLWWVLEQKVKFEERSLADLHEAYDDYKKKVSKFFPFVY